MKQKSNKEKRNKHKNYLEKGKHNIPFLDNFNTYHESIHYEENKKKQN